MIALALLWSTLVFAQTSQDLTSAELTLDLERGAYLVRAAECRSCHTANENAPFAGGYRLSTPFGDFFTPNITPDPDSGIGLWGFTEFRKALREGLSPSGRAYYPSFPYRSYSKITDRDMRSMFLYLNSQPPVYKVNRPHELSFPYSQRWLMFGWQELFFRGPSVSLAENVKVGMGPFISVLEKSDRWNRGAYLVEAVLHCAECHTPRNRFGAPLSSQWLAGSDILVGTKKSPNITPDLETGLNWSSANWMLFLSTGLTPRHTTPRGEMALVVQATSQLTVADRAAVVEYLMSQSPVKRFVGDETNGTSP